MLTWSVGILLVSAIAGLVFLVAAPASMTESYTQKPYTEFYILGPNGNATGYPGNLTVGETGTIIVGVDNYEHETVEYVLVVETSNDTVASREITIADEKRWRDRIRFSFDSPGRKVLALDLYRGNRTGSDPYRELYLHVTVSSD